MGKTKKKTEMKMVTVDQYMKENQLNEMELRYHLFNGDIRLFAWVSDLPLTHYWPKARYQVKNLDLVQWYNKTGYVDLFLSRSSSPFLNDLAHGLVGLSKGIALSALDTGSVELSERSVKQDIFITKHTIFMERKSGYKNKTIVRPKGRLPSGITSQPLHRRVGRRADYPSDLFQDIHLKTVIADIIPDFDFRAWEKDDVYRENNFELVKSTFETAMDEHRFIPESLLDRRTFVPVTFEIGKLLSEVTFLPDGDYRIIREVKAIDNLEPNQCRLELKMPPPVISRSQLVVFDINEDMYSLSGEAEDIELEDNAAPEELEDELDDQNYLYINDKRVLVLKGWLGANKKDASDELYITRESLWNELSAIDSRIFPPASIDTIKGFFKFQDVCKFKKGKRPGQ